MQCRRISVASLGQIVIQGCLHGQIDLYKPQLKKMLTLWGAI